MKINVVRSGGMLLTHHAKVEGFSADAELRVEDEDGDGDLDVSVYVGGFKLGTMELARLAANVHDEVLRAVKKFREMFPRKKKKK